MSTKTIAIVGAGSVGGALAQRFAAAGHAIVVGTRDGGSEPTELLARLGDRGRAAPIPEAVDAAEVVVVAVPGAAAVDVAGSLGDTDGKIVVDCTNPLRWESGPVWTPPAEGSNAQAIAAGLPGARVVKAWNGFGAELHANPTLLGEPVDVFLAGDDTEAKAVVSALAEASGFHPIDAGPLRNAALLENVAMLWIHLALVEGHGREVALSLVKRA